MSALAAVPLPTLVNGYASPGLRRAPLVRIALRPTEAAEVLGVSLDYFSEKIAPDLRIVRDGRTKLVAVAELERWLDDRASYEPGRQSC